MSETDTERQSGDDYDLPAEHVASFAEDKFDRRAGKICFGICAGEKANGTVGRVTAEGNRDRLKTEYGVEYDELAAEARNWTPEVTPERALDELDGHGGSIAEKSRREWEKRAEETEETDTSGSDTAGEFVDRLDAYCEERNVDYSDLTIMTDDDAEYFKRLEDDVKAVESERDRLVGMVGIDSSDAASLSLDSLRKIAENDRGVTDAEETLSPNPRSGDPQSDDVTKYSDPDRAADLKTRIEHLREHSGDSNQLAARQIEMYESELEDMT